jgi:hypothetical protein
MPKVSAHAGLVEILISREPRTRWDKLRFLSPPTKISTCHVPACATRLTGRECANTFRSFEWTGMVSLETRLHWRIWDPVLERAEKVSVMLILVRYTHLPAEGVWALRTGTCPRMRSRLFASPANAFSACSLHRNGVRNESNRYFRQIFLHSQN